MTESLHSPDQSATVPEQSSSGLVVVTPLSKPNGEYARSIAYDINKRLGTELWTPHSDVTHGRILRLETKLTKPEFETVIALSRAALEASAASQSGIIAQLDSIESSKDAVIARDTGNVEAVVRMRQWMLDSLKGVPNAEPQVKKLDFVHTTLGRRKADAELVPEADVLRVIRELAIRAIIQPIDRLVLAEETEHYVLTPRETIELR